MSYPTIEKHLKEQGVTVETANDEQLHKAFMAAFKDSLSKGLAYVEELVAKLRTQQENGGNKAMIDLDPNSEEGKQFARLLGPDIPRQILEREYGVCFGFYNCCGGVTAPTREALKLSMQEQILKQDPNFVNC